MSGSGSSSSTSQSTSEGMSTRSSKRKAIPQIAGPLPSANKSRKVHEEAVTVSLQEFVDKTAEEIVGLAISARNKRSVEDYAYVVQYDQFNTPENLTLPEDFAEHTNAVDRLISFLVSVAKLPIKAQKSLEPKLEIEVPDLIEKYSHGVVMALTAEADLPKQWKEKTDPIEIAKSAILWKRFLAYFPAKELKATHNFAFCHPSISGDGEKSSFGKFYLALKRLDGAYSAQRAKCVKTLIQIATKSRAHPSAPNVLEAHKISKAEIARKAKPQMEDNTKKRRRGATKLFITKEVWNPETFPFLTTNERFHLKARKGAYTKDINNFKDAWEKLPALDQYVAFSSQLSALRGLYQKYYQEVERISTSLHRRRTLFETYLRMNKIATPTGTKLNKSTVTYWEKETSYPTNSEGMSLVFDPRNVLIPATHSFFTNRNTIPEGDNVIVSTAVTVSDDFWNAYPNYKASSYTDNIAICRTNNAFRNLVIDDEGNDEQKEDDAIMAANI